MNDAEQKCYDAFNNGRRDEALRLLKKVKNPHKVKSKSNFTLLHCAAYHGWLDVVKQLIKDHQYNPDCKDDGGNTPLSKARSNGKHSVVDYLETYIAELESRCYEAFNYGRRDEALRLLKQVEDPHTVKSNNNFTVLHCAAYHGWLDVTKELIVEHQFDPDCKDDDGNTPLSRARSNGKQYVVDYLETVIGEIEKCYDAFNYGRQEEALRLLRKVKNPHVVKSSNNFTVLHCAAYHGWLDVVKQLINEHQFDPNCKDDDGNTPLSKARSNGKQRVVDYLETAIAEVETKCYDAFNYGRRGEAIRLLKQVKDPRTVMSNNKFTLLHCAAYHGWLDVVKQLVNEHQCDPDCEDDNGNTPLSKAKGSGRQQVVDYLERVIGSGTDNKAVRDQCFEAFNYGRREEAIRLLKKIKNPRAVKDSNNFTLLHCAAYHGWLDVVKELINDHDFDPNCEDDSGNTPLSKARSNGKQSVVDYLETTDKVDTKCYDAFNYGRREEALRLLKRVKDPHRVKSKSNFNILHCAAYHGWLDVVKQLINDHGFDPDCEDDSGNTPLSKARSNGKQSVVDYLEMSTGTEKKSVDDQCFDAFNYGRKEEALRLLKKIDDPCTVKDSNDFTLLHCAAYHGWLSVVKELINDYEFDPDCMDDDGNTPLMKAKSNEKQPVVDYLQTVLEKKCYDAFNYGRKEEALRLLKQVKDPRTVMSNNNFTLLHCAAYHGWLSVVKELINDHDCDPDCQDNDGNTPLSKARSNGKQPVVDYLKKSIGYSREDETDNPGTSIGSSGNTEAKCYDAFKSGRREEALKLLKEIDDPHAVRSNENITILHCAAYNGWLSVVRELINDHKFDPDCMDDDGNTPLMTAKSNSKLPVVNYLEIVIKKKCYDAFEKGRREEASRLLKQVEDPSTVMSNHNFTLLHCAASHGWLAVVKELINVHKWDPDCKDDDGTTPLSNAKSNGKQYVVDYLEKHLGIAPTLTTPPKEDRPRPMRDYSRKDTTDSGIDSTTSSTNSSTNSSDIKGARYKRYRDLLMKSPELDDIFPLLAKLSASWHDIGGRLRVPIGERQSLLQNTAISNDGKLERILDVWISSQPSDVTWKVILDMLIAFEKKNIASEVARFLDKQHIYDKYIQQDDFAPFDDFEVNGTAFDTPFDTDKKSDEELQKMEQAFQTSVQTHGALKVNLAHYMPFGPPGVGKTCLLRRLVDKDPLGDPATITEPCGNSQSTDAFEERHPIQVTVETGSHYEPKAVVTDNTKWAEVENVKEEIAILVKTLANRPDDSDSLKLDDSHSNEPSVFVAKSSNPPEVHPISPEVTTSPTKPSVDISHTPTSKHVSELVQKGIKNRNIDDVQELLDNSMTLYCTDTGGQPEFQEVLPALVAGPVVFLFIFNLLKGLNSSYDVTFRTPSQQFQPYTSSFTVKEVLTQFLTSIASYHSALMRVSRGLTQLASIPPPSVIVIGTHRDLLGSGDFDKIENELQQICKAASFKSLTGKSIIEPFNDKQHIIPINNYNAKGNDSYSVRKVIERIVKRDYNIEIPVPWLAFELHLRDLPKSAVTYTECKEISRGYNIPDDELPQCLMFLHHRTGTIRYYPDVEELKDSIIIKPSIIFRAVTELITSTFILKNVRDDEKEIYKKYGLFTRSSVEHIFSKHKFEISFEAFLALLKHLCILGPSHSSKHGDYFFPCALVHAPESNDTSTYVDPLLLVFGCGFVPKGFFSSLLAFLCQNEWEIERLSEDEPCLYRNEASFFVEELDVNVRLKATTKCLEVSIKDDELPPPDVLNKIVQILNKGSLEICSCLNYDEELSKPQLGFYCNYRTCRDKHFAIVHKKIKLKCEVTRRPYDMSSERKLWFQDCSSDTPKVPSTPHNDDKVTHNTPKVPSRPYNDDKVTHNPRNKTFRDLLKKPPEMSDVVPLMTCIAASWNEIGIALHVPFDYRDSLLKDLRLDDVGRMERVLCKWNGTQMTDVTWETILKVLNEKRDVASKVIEFLEKNHAKYINKDDYVCTHK